MAGLSYLKHKKWQVLAALFLIASQLFWFAFVFHAPGDRLTDYHDYDVFATASARGLDPYALQPSDVDSIARTRWGLGWQQLPLPALAVYSNHLGLAYSPLFYVLLRPLTFLDPLSGAMVWFIASCAALDVALLFLSELRQGHLVDPLMCILLAVFGPALQTLSGGQINAFLLLSLLVGLWGIGRKEPIVAGLGVSLSILSKPLPAVLGLVAYILWKRDLKSLSSTGIWLFVFVILTSPFMGLMSWGEYLSTVATYGRSLAPGRYVEEANLWTLLNRTVPEQFAPALAVGLSLFVLLLTGYAIWRGSGREWDLEVALLLTGILLITSSSLYHYLVILLIPLALLLRGLALPSNGWRLSTPQALVLISIILIELHALTWRQFASQPLLSSWGTAGLAILFGVLVWQVLNPTQIGRAPLHKNEALRIGDTQNGAAGSARILDLMPITWLPKRSL
jgi:Glycosyltransferase family 87